jgi:8-oxo-(d)GTP phosphatase
VEAAGGVLWRPLTTDADASADAGSVEVALVHRPRYDDWSLPKGKLGPDEAPLLGGLREVEEETGFRARAGRFLTETRYATEAGPKRVRYWAMEPVAGAFAPNHEVDRLAWLPVGEAGAWLGTDRDRPVLDAFTQQPTRTWACVVLRHAVAVERGRWDGDDRTRPLDATGQRQAKALTAVLAGYGVSRVLSSDTVRCLDTVAPFAEEHRLAVESEPLLSETGFARHPDAARARLQALAASGRTTVVCSHGDVVDDVVAAAVRALGAVPPSDTSARKAGAWVLHLAGDPDTGEPLLVAHERHDPPA